MELFSLELLFIDEDELGMIGDERAKLKQVRSTFALDPKPRHHAPQLPGVAEVGERVRDVGRLDGKAKRNGCVRREHLWCPTHLRDCLCDPALDQIGLGARTVDNARA